MNNERRKRLAAVAKQIDELPDLDEIKSELESIRDDEQEAYDAMPESLQQGERGQLSEAAIQAIENAIRAIDGFDPSGIVNDLDEAQQ